MSNTVPGKHRATSGKAWKPNKITLIELYVIVAREVAPEDLFGVKITR